MKLKVKGGMYLVDEDVSYLKILRVLRDLRKHCLFNTNEIYEFIDKDNIVFELNFSQFAHYHIYEIE